MGKILKVRIKIRRKSRFLETFLVPPGELNDNHLKGNTFVKVPCNQYYKSNGSCLLECLIITDTMYLLDKIFGNGCQK